MNEIPLMCHPQSLHGGVEAIKVTVTRGQNGEIELVYRVMGALEELKIASPATPDRVDGLWKNTCFEFFVKNSAATAYLEYNFAPSGQWAAYQFSGYRADMAELQTEAPTISIKDGDQFLTVSVTLQLPDTWQDADLWAGISVVAATQSGDIAYWAFVHPPGNPDFHHKDCFALQLEARSAA
jgi:hypothetical protein